MILLQQQIAMADRNQERNSRATLAKQAYLRQHIPAADYEDFGEFCEEVVGNIAIEGWSLEFVCQLVDQFKRKLAERKEQEKCQPQEEKSFHIYQTGKANQMREIAGQIKQEASKKAQNGSRTVSKAKEESAMDVLDSIFKDQKQVEFSSNKYNKDQFQSRNFWEVPVIENKQKENQKQSPPNFTKNNKHIQATQFASNKLPLEPQNFQKIFQTGLKIPEVKIEARKLSPRAQTSPEIQPNRILIKEQSNSPQTSDTINKKVTANSKKADIRLLSVKNLNSSKIPYEGQIIFPQPFKEFVSCFKSFQRHALSHKNLKVTITEHQIINRSFFSSDYVMYHLKVTPASIICKRNLQDFQRLRRNLESVYPGIRLPYLEKIGLFGSETNPDIIQKQKKYLTYFLEDLLNHSELKNFRILQDFLTLKDHKQIKRKFEEYDKMNKIKAIEELCLLEGAVKVEISEDNRQYNQHLSVFNAKMKNYWSSQERIFSQINDMHKRIAQCYAELAEAIDSVSKEIKDFNRRVSLNQIDSLELSFQKLLRYTNQNIKIHEQQSDLLRRQFLGRIRYERENMNTLDAVEAIRNDLTRTYLKRKDNEKASDNLEYLSQRLKDFKTNIIEQSKSDTVLKYQCGYMNNLMMNEGYHYFTLLGIKIERIIGIASFSKMESMAKTTDLYNELVSSS